MGTRQLAEIAADIAACRRCPRLAAYGAEVAQTKRRAFAAETYWGRPVPGFGDPAAHLLIIGLAPAAHGAHRTGRMFTGDRSGDFLYAALHRAGYANQAASRRVGDGLRLRGVFISAAARCAPPGNRPLPAEFAACRGFLRAEIAALKHLRVVLSLGGLAHQQFLLLGREMGLLTRPADYPFAHGIRYKLPNGWRLMACYHPSQQNTFTGRLTAGMLDSVLAATR